MFETSYLGCTQIPIHLFRMGTQERHLIVQSHLCATHFLVNGTIHIHKHGGTDRI